MTDKIASQNENSTSAAFFNWLINHPFWSFIGAASVLVGLVAAVINWLTDPLTPEETALQNLLTDILSRSATLSKFIEQDAQQVQGSLGGADGWQTAVMIHTTSVRAAVENLTASNEFGRLFEGSRRFFSISPQRLSRYEDPDFLIARKHSLRQHSCYLILNSIREISRIHDDRSIYECYPLSAHCREVVFAYGQKKKFELGSCLH